MRKRLSPPHIPSLDAASFPRSPSEQKGNTREYAVVGLVVEFVAEAAMGMRISPHRRTVTHVQGVRLNHANFASEEVICSRLE